jgi:DNA modification methylase
MNCIIVKNEIPNDIEPETILNINAGSVTKYTHGFHKYPAKFIPQIPKWAIEKYLKNKKNNIILDPFCGSGTTLVESALCGNYSIGFDIDPLSCLISKVKTIKINKAKLMEISTWLKQNMNKKQNTPFIPECETIEHWFTKDAIKKLSSLRAVINKITDVFGNNKNVKDIQNLILVCFSSIIRRVSNADNESQKSYVSHTKIKKPEETFSLFISQLDYFIERITLFSENSNIKSAKIFNLSSSNSMSKILSKKKIDLVVTSPPYIKAIDYIYNQMIELFWIGDLFQMQTQTKQNAKKALYIGNKQIFVNEFSNFSPYNSKLNIKDLDNNLQQVFDADKKNGHKHSYIAYKYFLEMEKHFLEISKYLSKNTHYIMVVGNSNVSGIYFNTTDFLIEMAKRNGLFLVNKWGYKIKSRFMRFDRKGRGGIIDIDWVLDFVFSPKCQKKL